MERLSKSNKKRVLPDRFVGSAKRVSAAPPPSKENIPKKRRIAKNVRSPTKKKTVPVNDENAPPKNNTAKTAAKGKPEEGQRENAQSLKASTLQKKTTGHHKSRRGVLMNRENGVPSIPTVNSVESWKSDSVVHGAIFHKIDNCQFSVCSIFWHDEHKGTGFYIRQRPCTSACSLVCNCKLVCTCFHVIQDYLNMLQYSNLKLKEGLEVKFHDQEGQIVKSIGVRDVLAYCSQLDYAVLSLKDFASHVEPFIDFANPPVSEKYIHMIGFPEKTERMVETNLKVINVGLFLEEHFDMFYDEEEVEIKDKHHLVYHCDFAHGSSGSPIVDNIGRIVGIHKKGYNNTDGRPGYRVKLGVKMVPVLLHANERFGLFPDGRDRLLELYNELLPGTLL